MSTFTRRALLVAVLGVAAMALLWNRSGSRSPPHPAVHGQPLVAFAVSPDGRSVATGAEASSYHADDPVEGAILWDVATGLPKARIDVPGGVGLTDQLRHGLAFTADGALLGINGHTNGVFTARTDDGRRLADVYATGNDGPPAFVFSDDGRKVAVGDGGLGPIMLVFPTDRTIPEGTGLPLVESEGPYEPVRLDDRELQVVAGGVLRRVPLTGGPAVDRERLLPSSKHVARRGRLLAVGGDDGLAIHDFDLGQVLVRPPVRDVADLAFAGAADRVVAIVELRGKKSGWPVIVDASGWTARLGFALARIDWLRFPDALPAALSPDGTEALLVGSDGAIERWALDATPRRVGEVARREGVLGVAWPTADRAVLVGRRILQFVEMPSGRVVSETTFPEAAYSGD